MKNRGKKYQLGGAFGPGQMLSPPPPGAPTGTTTGSQPIVGQTKPNLGNKTIKLNNKNVSSKNTK